jgi:hypothetical protein
MAAAPRSLPWTMLVAPSRAWSQLAASHSGPLPAVLVQVILAVIGWLAARGAMYDLSESAGLTPQGSPRPSLVLELFALGGAVLLFNYGFALLLWLWTKLLGAGRSYRELACWVAYSHLPVFLGRAVALITFAIVRPLATDPGQALALQLSPSSFGVAALLQPLSFLWVMAALFDVFGLWMLWLAALGGRMYLRYPAPQTALAVTTLMLLWLLVLTGVWRGAQGV